MSAVIVTVYDFNGIPHTVHCRDVTDVSSIIDYVAPKVRALRSKLFVTNIDTGKEITGVLKDIYAGGVPKKTFRLQLCL
jgi:hypothetical protein